MFQQYFFFFRHNEMSPKKLQDRKVSCSLCEFI